MRPVGICVLLWLLLASKCVMACQISLGKPFRDELSQADHVFIFRLESLGQIAEPIAQSYLAADGKTIKLRKTHRQMVAGKIRIVRVLRGKPTFKFVTFSTSMCGGRRLDVSHYFVVATSQQGQVVELQSTDRSILDLWSSYSEDVSDRDNDKQHILRPIVAFLAGKKLPNDFPSIDILQYTQSGATPPPLPNEAR